MRSEDEGCVGSLPGTGAEWVVCIHSDEVTPDLQRALDQWRAVSKENDVDFRRAEAVWRLTGALAHDPAIQAELAWLRRKAQAPVARAPWGMSAARSRLAMAATIVVAIAAAMLLVSSRGTDWHQTARGSRSVVHLPDGSSIEVNTDSRVGVTYSATGRNVTLEKGEALFEVSHDALLRPFTVHVRNGDVRAVGTRFNIITEGDLVTVTLLHGRVEVVTRGAAGEEHTQLGAGEAVAYDQNGVLPADPTTASARRIESWRKDRWSFDDWSLERAAREHNRYVNKPIRIDDAGLAQKRISGVFRIGDTDAFLTAVSRNAHAKVVDQGDSLLLVPAEE